VASEIPEFGSAYAAEQLRRSRHPLRRLIKKFYLDRVLGEVEAGPSNGTHLPTARRSSPILASLCSATA